MFVHLNRVVRLIYGCYAWTAFGCVAILTTIVLLLLPSLKWRRGFAKAASRFALTIIGVHCRLHNERLLPAGPCVIVANHSSYVDGVLLKAALPSRFSFVIKKEMVKMPIAGLLLKRIDSQF